MKARMPIKRSVIIPASSKVNSVALLVRAVSLKWCVRGFLPLIALHSIAVLTGLSAAQIRMVGS